MSSERDLFSEVRPTGWLLERLINISNPRKHRWNAYLRACRAIPKSSPVYGSTSWDTINKRRGHLIDLHIGKKISESHAEFRALQRIAGEVCCGPIVAQNFLLGRVLRRLKSKHCEV